MGSDIQCQLGSQEGEEMAAQVRRWPCFHLGESRLQCGWVTEDARFRHALQKLVVERGEVVLRDEDQGSLVEAPLAAAIELLSKDTRTVQGLGTAMGRMGRGWQDVWCVVGDGEVEGQVLGRLRVLLLGEAAGG